MAGIEPLLVLAVAALNLAVVAGRVRTDELVEDAQLSGSFLKQRRQVPFAARKPVGEFKPVVRLDTFHLDPTACVPRGQPPQEVRRGVGGLFRIGGQKTKPCELVDGGVLEQSELGIRDAASWNDLHIDLYTLSGMGHLLVGLGSVLLFRLLGRKQTQPAHDPEQAFRAAGVAPGLQAVPELDHAQGRVSAAHVTDKLQLGLRVLVRMAVRASGVAGQGRHSSVPTLFPEVDVGATFVVLPACPADAVFFRVLHQGLTIGHVLCYTVAHERYGSFR